MNLENLTKAEYIRLEAASRAIKEACIEIYNSGGNLEVAYRLYRTDPLANSTTTFGQFKETISGIVRNRNLKNN